MYVPSYVITTRRRIAHVWVTEDLLKSAPYVRRRGAKVSLLVKKGVCAISISVVKSNATDDLVKLKSQIELGTDTEAELSF